MFARLSSALFLSALVLGACSDDDQDAGPATSTTSREDLYGAQVSVVGEQVWVFGGHVAAEGTAPPMSSMVPPGWEPNRAVVAYSANGELTRRFELPGRMAGALTGAALFEHGGAHHLLGTLCDMADGCATDVEPLLFRLDGEVAERVELSLPNLPVSGSIGVGLITPLGVSEGTAWALQLVTQAGRGYAGYADRHRLLGIDLTSGAATEVELPADIYGEAFVCMGGSSLFVAQANLDEAATLNGVSIMRRAASTAPSAWEQLVALPVDLPNVYEGSLTCVDALDELVLAIDVSPTHLFTFDQGTGEATAPPGTLPGRLHEVLGVVDGTAMALASDESYTPAWWRHRRTEPWELDEGLPLPDSADLIVLGGRIVDATNARLTIGPDPVRLPEVEI